MTKTNWQEKLKKILSRQDENIVMDLMLEDFISELLKEKEQEIIKAIEETCNAYRGVGDNTGWSVAKALKSNLIPIIKKIMK